ncbi:MAG: hypothetical protein WBD55_06885 [Dehalococcoidia bacterium]
MTKLSALLRKTGRSEPAPFGFGSAPRKSSPTMLLVALIGERWQKGVADAAVAGADAFVLTGKPGDGELASAIGAADVRPCGLLLTQPADGDLERVCKAGVDFLIVAPDAPAATLTDDDLGTVLQVKDELSDIQLRVIEGLSLDAIYLEQQTGALTIRQQMDLQRISGLTRKPLLLHVRLNADQDDLLSLRDAGALLVGIDMKERDAIDALRRLRGVIDALPPHRKPRRDERQEVTLPRTAAREKAEEDEEGEGAAMATYTSEQR